MHDRPAIICNMLSERFSTKCRVNYLPKQLGRQASSLSRERLDVLVHLLRNHRLGLFDQLSKVQLVCHVFYFGLTLVSDGCAASKKRPCLAGEAAPGRREVLITRRPPKQRSSESRFEPELAPSEASQIAPHFRWTEPRSHRQNRARSVCFRERSAQAFGGLSRLRQLEPPEIRRSFQRKRF